MGQLFQQIFDNNFISIIGTLVALSIALVKIIDVLLKKVLPKSSSLTKEEVECLKQIQCSLNSIHNKIDTESILTDEEHAWLRSLKESHNRWDENGVPLWYFPRSFIETQKDISKILQSISLSQEKTIFILESVLKDKLEQSKRDKINGGE